MAIDRRDPQELGPRSIESVPEARTRGRPKPLDIGNGSLAASFGPTGEWLSLGAPHPTQGFVELNGLPPFDAAWRGDRHATRRYRASMSNPRFAFLVMEAKETVASPDVAATAGGIVQRWRLGGAGCLRFRGQLDCPALAEITEINPPQPTGAATRLRVEGASLCIDVDALPGSARLTVSGNPPLPGAWRLIGPNEAELQLPEAAGERWIEITARLNPAAAGRPARDGPRPGSASRLPVPDALRPAAERVTLRALAYVRGCTALRIVPDERVILTDHRLLPLSWTRDAYYQALLLLATDVPDDRDIVADHLRWLWRRCERPDARWVRSHHADGRRKDLAFQIDQQLYPLLELVDYWRAARELPQGVAWSRLVRDAWQAALDEVDPATGLAATTESAADDPAPMPFILSSQILLWYTARRLAEASRAGALDLDTPSFEAVAGRVRASVDEHLADADGWAYATDGRAGRLRQHDANDLPTALAPLWGFCVSDDPSWRRTMRFALSGDNPAYFDGPFGGLGSLHTPGPWPLGDIQAWLFHALADDVGAAAAAMGRLCAVAFDDGMLPEAYDPLTGRPVARDWFAWPGALLGSLLMLDGRGRLDRLLAAT